MKKFLTAALSLTFVAGACIGLTGCKPSMGKIQDDLYDLALSTNYTCISEEGNTYDKSAVVVGGTYESWEKTVETKEVDLAGMKAAVKSSAEMSMLVAGSVESVTVVGESYYFVQSERYFKVSKNYDANGVAITGEGAWSVHEYEDETWETAKESFMGSIGSYDLYGALEYANQLNDTADLYKWNKDAERYELTIGTSLSAYTRLKKDGGVVIYNTNTAGVDYEMMTFNKVGETTVSIPAEATAAVTAYIAIA